jgi:GNAT superfamily N-acetyltransferase
MDVRNLGPEARYHTRLLDPPDIQALQGLLERAGDYFEIATGAPPAADEATRAYVAGPPMKSVDDKRIIGLFDERDQLIGVLDALMDWPDPGTWSMGILLLDPGHRGHGLGTAALAAYESWARDQGAREFRTAVMAHHADGRRFIEQAGYSSTRTIDDYNAGARNASVLFFAKTVT